MRCGASLRAGAAACWEERYGTQRVLHGSSHKIPSRLTSSGFETIGELISFLEGSFRSAVDYLKDVHYGDLPYDTEMGCEKLLWSG